MQRVGGKTKINLISRLFYKKAYLSLAAALPVVAFFVMPVFGYTKVARSDQETLYSPQTYFYNSQTVALLNSKARPETKGSTGGADPIQSNDGALVADVSPITDVNPDAFDFSSVSNTDISVYKVREGDTLGTIAEMFNISANTIRWANDIDVKGTIKPGQDLVILPISGIKHKVAKGETFATIAKKYKADAREISLFNGIEESETLVAGTEIVIPNGEVAETAPAKKPTPKGAPSKEAPSGYYIRPVKGIETQGPHDSQKAIDVGAKTGTPIWAMASGKVIVVKQPPAYNGGYGGLVIIAHDNGTQTLYAHQSKIAVTQGQTVKQGEVIGYVGSTGRSTGPHLHFEIRPGKSGLNTYAIAAKMY